MALKAGDGSGKGKMAPRTGAAFNIAQNWHQLPKGFEGDFDACLNGGGPFAGNMYIFKGKQYIKYSWNTDRAEPGYPKTIAGNWPGMPQDFCSDIDAAVNGMGPFSGNAYFFKGGSYVKFDWANDRAYADCPKRIAGNWPGLPEGFDSDFDAVLNGNGKYAGKVYFFKGDSYIRFDWNKDSADTGYPVKIADGWNNLPEQFRTGLGTAIDGFGPFSGKAYMFKGNDYVRYDWAKDLAEE